MNDTTAGYSPAELKRKACGRLAIGFVVSAVAFFLSAGTLSYWEAWLYLAVLFIPVTAVLSYLLKRAPDLLERRMRTREKEGAQKRVIRLSIVVFLAAFVLPGFDKRYGWSAVSPLTVILADVIIGLGYALFFLVLRENRFAARTIEVEREQKVISTGPYAVIRHPMYLAVLALCIPSPLALGSYWAIIPMAVLPAIMVTRIRSEEAMLLRDLKGYREYVQKTRYRLLPGVW